MLSYGFTGMDTLLVMGNDFVAYRFGLESLGNGGFSRISQNLEILESCKYTFDSIFKKSWNQGNQVNHGSDDHRHIYKLAPAEGSLKILIL